MSIAAEIITEEFRDRPLAEIQACIAWMTRYRPLFEGLPRGLSLAEAGRLKAASSDSLGIEFMREEAAS